MRISVWLKRKNSAYHCPGERVSIRRADLCLVEVHPYTDQPLDSGFQSAVRISVWLKSAMARMRAGECTFQSAVRISVWLKAVILCPTVIRSVRFNPPCGSLFG